MHTGGPKHLLTFILDSDAELNRPLKLLLADNPGFEAIAAPCA